MRNLVRKSCIIFVVVGIIIIMFVLCILYASAAVLQQPEEEVTTVSLRNDTFPENFRFAVASASYQIEGAWNLNGKGENIWDRFTHDHPTRMLDESNGDIACDSYHKYEEDVRLIKELGVSVYRFSLSWSRILPTGYTNVINEDGINYYNNLINELIRNGIEPMVTIFHWDLPQPLQEIGGWPNEQIVQAYVDYAEIAFKNFGDRVKIWNTINEPRQVCKMGYGDAWIAPSKFSPGIGDYLCVRHLLKAHAAAYHLYKDKFKSSQGGLIGTAIDSFWFQPATDSVKDKEAADRVFDFYTGIFTNPIFGSGDFPESVKKFVKERSEKQNFGRSRLPEFSETDINNIKGTSDFFGLNFYTSVIVANTEEKDLNIVDWDSDMNATFYWEDDWETAASWWLRVTPWNLPKALADLKSRYGDIPIYITENGLSDHENKEDYQRANYYLRHLSACLEAIYDYNVNLQMFTAWSLMDNFEWTHGYENRFGLYHVDFNNPNRPRTPKLSADTYSKVAKGKTLPSTTIPVPGGTTIIKSSLILVTILSIVSNVLFAC